MLAAMAKDKYMPRMFSVRGDRLFELYHHFRCWGYLAYYHFDGKTENLIPLYAVGVFIPFTLAQYGMVLKWIRGREKGGLAN